MTRQHDRISHVVIAVKPDRFDQAVRDASTVFGAAFDVLVRKDLGVQVAMSWDAGIELQSPLDLDDESPLSVFLRDRGEGILAFVHRVENLDAAVERARGVGLAPVARMDGLAGVEKWAQRFTRIDEAMFLDFYGAVFALGQIEEAEGSGRAPA